MKKAILILVLTSLLVILLAASVFAQSSLKVNIWVGKNQSVRTDSVKATLGNPDEPDTAEFAYELLHVDANETLYSTHFNAQFRRIDTFEDVQEVFVSERIPYRGNFGKLRITFENGSTKFVLWSFDLKQLCDRDGSCDHYENTITCPQDCLIPSPDLLCFPRVDNACDPDCAEGVDPDCVNPKEPERGLILITSVIILILLIVIILLLLKWHKPKRRRRQGSR